MRTRTKIQIAVSIWVIIMGSIIIIGNAISERSNAGPLLFYLLGGDVLKWGAHVAGVVAENIYRKE
jgi:hypothetical protein